MRIKKISLNFFTSNLFIIPRNFLGLNKITITFLPTGLFIIIGIAIWGGKYDNHNGDPPAYPTTLGVIAAFMFILGGIFFILDVAMGGGGGGSK